jgi:ubiquinone/menaquinone biosynthesis C-methylase UbiE
VRVSDELSEVEATEAAIQRVHQYFQENVELEWERLSASVEGRVAFELHRRFLRGFVGPGMRILEIGAGPGRFTSELAALGARAVVTDISANQLAANRTRAKAGGYADSIESWVELDVRNTSQFADATFDAVTALGGPLSYIFDHAEDALAGLLRVTRPGGYVVASVMSTLGAYRTFFPAASEFTDDQLDYIVGTGDLREAQPEGHVCKMYTSAELRELVAAAGGQVVAMSASAWTAIHHEEVVAEIERHPDRWARYLDREVAASAAPGALDGATHILVAATHRP